MRTEINFQSPEPDTQNPLFVDNETPKPSHSQHLIIITAILILIGSLILGLNYLILYRFRTSSSIPSSPNPAITITPTATEIIDEIDQQLQEIDVENRTKVDFLPPQIDLKIGL